MGTTGALADNHNTETHEQDRILAAFQRGRALPLTRILQISGRAVPGDTIKVELETKGKVLIYKIKVLTNTGRIRELKIHARTGAILEIEDD